VDVLRTLRATYCAGRVQGNVLNTEKVFARG
jgi:hypothetical protein